jgi:hypothetical protein
VFLYQVFSFYYRKKNEIQNEEKKIFTKEYVFSRVWDTIQMQKK